MIHTTFRQINLILRLFHDFVSTLEVAHHWRMEYDNGWFSNERFKRG